MAQVLETNINSVLNRLDGKLVRLRRNLPNISQDFLKEAKRKMRLQLTYNKTFWNGKTWDSIMVRKMSNQRSVLVMDRQGVWLDRMKPHWVKLKRGLLIHKWALQKGSDKVKAAAKAQRSIFVNPHPFIDQSIAKALIRLPIIIKNKLNKSLEA